MPEESWGFPPRRHHLAYQHEVCERGLRLLAAARTEFILDRGKANALDRPFTHRFLEIIYNTMPTDGHGRISSEPLLEKPHQQFKSWVSMITYSINHITTMNEAMARNGLERFDSLQLEWFASVDFNRNRTETGLWRLLLGEDLLRVIEYAPNGRM